MAGNNIVRDKLFLDAIKQIRKKDDTYPVEAYFFIRSALDVIVKVMDKPATGPGRHVSGQELLEGMRLFALQEFGPMALTVMNSWNINCTEDFGNLVFHMVENGILGSTAEDTRDDFINGYDFDDAFRKPFLPSSEKDRNNSR